MDAFAAICYKWSFFISPTRCYFSFSFSFAKFVKVMTLKKTFVAILISQLIRKHCAVWFFSLLFSFPMRFHFHFSCEQHCSIASFQHIKCAEVTSPRFNSQTFVFDSTKQTTISSSFPETSSLQRRRFASCLHVGNNSWWNQCCYSEQWRMLSSGSEPLSASPARNYVRKSVCANGACKI